MDCLLLCHLDGGTECCTVWNEDTKKILLFLSGLLVAASSSVKLKHHEASRCRPCLDWTDGLALLF
jgi:hypothetical protein